jgi:hypothetical protein
MPQIAKGGKYVFGWSRIREDGKIVIPEEAFDEYGLKVDDRVILVSGSKTSGGFGVTSKRLLEGSHLSVILTACRLDDFRVPEGKPVEFKGRLYCWSCLQGNSFKLGGEALAGFGARAGTRLLSIRSSDIAIGMAVRGPLIEKAGYHPEIMVF